MEDTQIRVHETADVSPGAQIGRGTSIWNQARVREGAVMGQGCILGTGAYVDCDVVVGSNVKIQNGALLYRGATLEDGVFIGPGACLTNDVYPRAVNPDGTIKTEEDWTVGPILIRYGASIGAGAIVLPGVTVGRFALVAAGSVVSRDVPDHGLVMGVPARLTGHVCRCAHRLVRQGYTWRCPSCGRLYEQTVTGSLRDSLVQASAGA
jgi:UDP-2-acetamido-3-amino-2,3-dideoxy-glucuronate N-acetyltransferase